MGDSEYDASVTIKVTLVPNTDLYNAINKAFDYIEGGNIHKGMDVLGVPKDVNLPCINVPINGVSTHVIMVGPMDVNQHLIGRFKLTQLQVHLVKEGYEDLPFYGRLVRSSGDGDPHIVLVDVVQWRDIDRVAILSLNPNLILD